MDPLPTAYMKVLRRITGFFGAYPLAQDLAPGMIGRRVEGRFVRDADLADLPGFDSEAFATKVEPARGPTDAWLSDEARVKCAGIAAGGPALPAGGRVRLEFSAADQAAFLCRNGGLWAFSNPRKVKAYILWLQEQDHWDRRDIVIMAVMKTDAAWMFFSSQRGQSVELALSAAPPAGAPAAEILKAAIGSGTLQVGRAGLASSGYSASVTEPATPLFQAVRLKRFLRPHTVDVTKGEDNFEEATFGDSAAADAADG